MKIVVRQPNTDPQEYAFAEGDEVTIGRQPDVNRVVITDIKLSRRHGTLRMADGVITYTDENSGNGSFVKDEKLPSGEAVTIKVGTAVHLGDAVLAVEEGEPKASATFDSGAADSKPRGENLLPDGKTGMLEAIDGPLKGKTFGLGERPLFLGRVPACHICCTEDKLLSRRNTEISLSGSTYRIKDLDSANGTYLNGEKTEKGLLHDGDELTVGESRFRFSFVDADSAPPVPTPQTVETSPAASAQSSSPEPDAGVGPSVPSGGSKSMPAMIAVAVVVVILVAAGIFFATREKKPDGQLPAPGDTPPVGGGQPTGSAKEYPVRLGRPLVLDMEVTLEKTANIHAARRDVVPFTVGAKVETVHVKNQERVKEGDKLVTFELTEALKAARTQAQSSVESARAEIDKAEAGVKKAERALTNARDNLKIAQEAHDKNKPLYDAGNLLQDEWDQIRTKLNDARASVDIREQEKTQAERTVAQVREKLRQAAAKLDDIKAKVNDLTVTAKTAGVVDGLNLKPGFTVTPETQSMAIVDYEKQVKAVAAIPEDDIVKIRRGMKADVWLSRAPDRIFPGVVTEIPPTARQRNYDVEITVANQDNHFRPGAQAKVRFEIDTHANALAVPVAVLGTGKRGGYHVFVVDPSTRIATQVPVKRGVETMVDGRKVVEILPDPEAARSVTPDDLLVVDGHKSLQDGTEVKILNKAELGLE